VNADRKSRIEKLFHAAVELNRKNRLGFSIANAQIEQRIIDEIRHMGKFIT
jgi:hypothetical protein